LTVFVIGDRSVEPDEGFTVTLTNAVNGTIDSDNNSAEGVILDDDGEQLPLVSIANASQPEGNSGEANLVFMVSLSTPVGETVYATADGTAAAGTDYTAVSGTLTFASGDTEQTISVPILGDTDVELAETFTVILSDPANADLGQATATGTIENDDAPPPLVFITDVSQAEGNEGMTDMVFTVTRGGGKTEAVTVDYATADGTAAAGTDYTAVSGTLTFVTPRLTARPQRGRTTRLSAGH
jgi:chitinase